MTVPESEPGTASAPETATETETETETGNWQSGIVKEYMGHEQVREYECSRVLWLKTARMSEE